MQWVQHTLTLGTQPASSVVVLPNMDGIIATFKCVRRPPYAPSNIGGQDPSSSNVGSPSIQSDSALQEEPEGSKQAKPEGSKPAKPEGRRPPEQGIPNRPGHLTYEAGIRVWTSEGVTGRLPVTIVSPVELVDGDGCSDKKSKKIEVADQK
ncbi:MAG: hypothetical protein QF512_17925 [Alphaproteobacteria bacterium]|nr:hypothetical protein [Alphaproteobacteria bacterium]